MAETLTVKDRAIGAIVGSLVADAATMPVHWIYDLNKLNQILGASISTPEFFDPPSCPYYQYELGRNTPYGEGVLHLLEFLAKNDAKFDPVKYSQESFIFFDTQFTGRLNHSIKEFIKNIKEGKNWPNCGADDNQADGLTKVGVITAAYYGTPDLLPKINEATRVTQNNDKAAAMALAAARILESVILGKKTSEAVKEVGSKILQENPESDVLAKHIDNLVASKLSTPHTQVVSEIGSACSFPNSFVNGCHLLLKDDVDFASAVRQTLLAGGDNASRALFIGAVLGAKYGVQGIPREWLPKTKQFDAILEWAKRVVNHSSNL